MSTPSTTEKPLLSVENLSVEFRTSRGVTEAVKSLSIEIKEGETLAIVGESGSGKSATALALTRLLPSPPAHYGSGSVNFEGRNLLKISSKELRRVRGGDIAYIFQEPSTSLNPVFTVGAQVAEAISLHRPNIKDVRKAIIEAFDEVGIRMPEKRVDAYPHELSGGMQQRVMIAMALACQPKLLIADEPTTALDVTIQAQVMDLLKEIKAKRNMSILLITHNFGIVKGFAERVAVMFRGQIVETGKCDEVLENPQHPYTKALIACIPRLGGNQKRLVTIDYDLLDSPKGK